MGECYLIGRFVIVDTNYNIDNFTLPSVYTVRVIRDSVSPHTPLWEVTILLEIINVGFAVVLCSKERGLTSFFTLAFAGIVQHGEIIIKNLW